MIPCLEARMLGGAAMEERIGAFVERMVLLAEIRGKKVIRKVKGME